jgi:hypothetical protein
MRYLQSCFRTSLIYDSRHSFLGEMWISLCLIEIYHGDFSNYDHEHIQDNLHLFNIHAWKVEDLRDFIDIWKTHHVSYSYCLVELALLLPLAIERAFSSMKIIKTKLHNKISAMNSWWIEYVLHRGRDVQTSSSIKLWKIFKIMVELCQCIWLLYVIKASLLVCFRLYLCSNIYVLISIVLIDYIRIIYRINVLGLFWPLHHF